MGLVKFAHFLPIGDAVFLIFISISMIMIIIIIIIIMTGAQ